MEAQNPLSSSQFYPYFHQFLLESGVCKQDGLNSEELFAEVFAICRQAVTDQTPGENLTSRYVDELRSRTGNSRQADLILCLAWVALTVQDQPSYAETAFTKSLQPIIRRSAYFSKARQLAITIRQHERHIKTDFLVDTNPIPAMKVQIEGDPGQGNTYNENTYNINKVETLAPNATTVVTKHYHINGGPSSNLQGASDEDLEALADEATTDNPKPNVRKNPKTLVDTEVVREEILTWVSKVRPLLDDAWKADFQNIWSDILNMQEVKEKVYDPGKQKNTNFNQYLVGNILYYMFEDCGAQSEDKEYNASALCTALIGTTDHQLRKELSKNPPEEIKNRLYDYFTKRFEI
jgi:hypothetical protein